MSLLDYFKAKRKTSADHARDRLSIIVSHERSQKRKNHSNFNLQELQQKLIDVIKDHLHLSEDKFSVELERNADRSILELNVTLPDSIEDN